MKEPEVQVITFLAYNIYGIGGSVRFIANTVNFLSKNGFKVKIISCFRTSEKPSFFLDGKIEIISLVDRRRKNLIMSALSKLPSKFDHYGSDTYGTYSLLTDVLLAKALFFLKTDFLICSTSYFASAAFKPHLYKRLTVMQEHIGFEIHQDDFKENLLKQLKKADYVHCVNKKDAEIYRGILPNSDKVFTIYNSIDTYKNKSLQTQPVIISTGRLAYQKNFPLLIDAFAEFKKYHPEWKLKILGNGQEKSILIEKILEHKLSNDVILVPATPKVREHLLGSSIYVCSSRYESFCISLLEAMECGLACISLECDGPSEYLENNVNGIMVPQDDCSSLVMAMCKCAESTDFRQMLAGNAKRTAEQFSTPVICKEWRNFFNERYL